VTVHAGTFSTLQANFVENKGHIPLRYPGRRPVASWNLAS